MGADGGIKITKISSIKRDWKNIKESLIDTFDRELKNCEEWEKEFSMSYYVESVNLPEDILHLSNEEVCGLFNYLRSCDCPYLFGEFIITAEGDYVADQMQTLSWILNGESVETWT